MKAAFRQLSALARLSLLELWRRHEVFAFLLLALALVVADADLLLDAVDDVIGRLLFDGRKLHQQVDALGDGGLRVVGLRQ